MQRVALARALVVEPRVLLLDEPTANLDPYNVSLIENLIRDQNRENGITVVLVTHNVFQAKRLAHRTGLMLNGSLVELADTGTFFSAPADPRTRALCRRDGVLMIQVDPWSDVPVYQQIVEQVRLQVATGHLTPGERLEPVRQLGSAPGDQCQHSGPRLPGCSSARGSSRRIAVAVA